MRDIRSFPVSGLRGLGFTGFRASASGFIIIIIMIMIIIISIRVLRVWV